MRIGPRPEWFASDNRIQSVYHRGQPDGVTRSLSSDSKKLIVAQTGQRCALCGQMFERYAVPYKGQLVCIDCAMRRLNLSIFGLEVE